MCFTKRSVNPKPHYPWGFAPHPTGRSAPRPALLSLRFNARIPRHIRAGIGPPRHILHINMCFDPHAFRHPIQTPQPHPYRLRLRLPPRINRRPAYPAKYSKLSSAGLILAHHLLPLFQHKPRRWRRRARKTVQPPARPAMAQRHQPQLPAHRITPVTHRPAQTPARQKFRHRTPRSKSAQLCPNTAPLPSRHATSYAPASCDSPSPGVSVRCDLGNTR